MDKKALLNLQLPSLCRSSSCLGSPRAAWSPRARQLRCAVRSRRDVVAIVSLNQKLVRGADSVENSDGSLRYSRFGTCMAFEGYHGRKKTRRILFAFHRPEVVRDKIVMDEVRVGTAGIPPRNALSVSQFEVVMTSRASLIRKAGSICQVR
jgi:hypothetical protein